MKSEKEKSKEGVLYDANNDRQLLSKQSYCKDLCFECNNLLPLCREDRHRRQQRYGADSVVMHDIPDNVVAAGNSCRVLKGIPQNG
ncbi:MAG: hypothetical protein LBL33_05775 [Tannerella sp.]|jgi:hypothetical protein|nr:hypothetical protein [Tannerella sp.]